MCAGCPAPSAPSLVGGVGNSREHHIWGHRLLFPTICMTMLSALPLGSRNSSGAERTSPGREALADAGSRTRVPQVRARAGSAFRPASRGRGRAVIGC